MKNPKDKMLERERFEERSKIALSNIKIEYSDFGSKLSPFYLKDPYLLYEDKINNIILPKHKVLELGSGTGRHTLSLLNTGAQITATDLSPSSLNLLKIKLKKFRNLTTVVSDIESLPFENESFDIVTSAGSLSYGDAEIVDREIRRVLNSNGSFICVDSLNNNPIYRLNRFIHYLKGDRTKMTLQNMPTLERLESLNEKFSKVETHFFGSITYLMPLLSKIVGDKFSQAVSRNIDNLFQINKSAFKFVLVAKV
jgi:ubiquinone/menaquinone biosynthesis C-methylase UbiE